MEYTRIYPINRRMHITPCAVIVRLAEEFSKKYTGLEISLENEFRGEKLDVKSLSSLLFGLGRNDVKVSVKGDYSKEILENCAEIFGSFFRARDNF
jgi:hypothetical protein